MPYGIAGSGKVFVSSQDGTSSNWVETTFPGAPRGGLVVPGYIWNVIRIR